MSNFKQYVELLLPAGGFRAHCDCERWNVAVAPADGFRQASFVNGIATSHGGTHVTAVLDKLCKAVLEAVKAKRGGAARAADLSPRHIRDRLWLFVDATIENPAFSSQTKDELITKAAAFGSAWAPSPAFVSKIADSDIVAHALAAVAAVAESRLAKTGGKKTAQLRKNPKGLEDAHDAGGKASNQCTLILTEGESAKAFAVAGLEVVGRARWGVFPLKGKLLNVREASAVQQANNAELTALKSILGLQHGRSHVDAGRRVEGLRYGRVLVLTDQDPDGSHIKGLVLNAFHCGWPELVEVRRGAQPPRPPRCDS